MRSYRERVADDDETGSGTAEQKLAMRWESLDREHDRIGSDRFWEIIYEGFARRAIQRRNSVTYWAWKSTRSRFAPRRLDRTQLRPRQVLVGHVRLPRPGRRVRLVPMGK